MNFQEINMAGKFWVQKVSSVPTWASGDEGRILYNTGDDYLYFGENGFWEKVTPGDATRYIRRDTTTTQTHQCTIRPTTDATRDLGASSYRYNKVYAVEFVGEATAATYSDLAEKYTTDKEYPTGTVMCVGKSEEYELEACNGLTNSIVGVISDAPGFLLNKELEDGQIVGLTGKVPIRVNGAVNKGDFLVPSVEGRAKKGTLFEVEYKFAIALETKELDDQENLVMSIIK